MVYYSPSIDISRRFANPPSIRLPLHPSVPHGKPNAPQTSSPTPTSLTLTPLRSSRAARSRKDSRKIYIYFFSDAKKK